MCVFCLYVCLCTALPEEAIRGDRLSWEWSSRRLRAAKCVLEIETRSFGRTTEPPYSLIVKSFSSSQEAVLFPSRDHAHLSSDVFLGLWSLYAIISGAAFDTPVPFLCCWHTDILNSSSSGPKFISCLQSLSGSFAFICVHDSNSGWPGTYRDLPASASNPHILI